MEPDLETPPRFKAELRATLLAHPAVRLPGGTVTATLPWARRRLVPALALGVAALAVVLVIAPGGGGGLASPRASAAAVLNASAVALENSGTSLSLSRGQYFYVREAVWFRYAYPGTRPFVVRSLSQAWIARNGSSRERVRVLGVTGRPSFPYKPLAHSYTVRTGPQARPFSLDTPDAQVARSYAQLRALPTDPRTLSKTIDRLVARGLPPYARDSRGLYRSQLLGILRFSVLRGIAESPTPPQVRAAVYRALALTPGVRLLGRRSDAAGRTGMAVAANLGAVELILIIDPSTGQLLQSSRTLLRRSPYLEGWPQGLVNSSTILASGVVGSARATIR